MKRQRNLIDDSLFPIFITTTIVRWIPVFEDCPLAENCLRKFEDYRKAMGVSVYAYVLMPNHFHGIVKTSQKGDLSELMRTWKSASARMLIESGERCHQDWLNSFQENAVEYKVRGQKYQVWMPRFDDFAIRNERELAIKMNYIHGNPMKHGIIEKAEDYPFSSLKDYLGGTNGYVTIDCGQGKP
jgi:putative transposase